MFLLIFSVFCLGFKRSVDILSVLCPAWFEKLFFIQYCSPFARFGVFPVGGRSTAIQLQKGGVWILASTPLDVETKATLDKLGPVKYILLPSSLAMEF